MAKKKKDYTKIQKMKAAALRILVWGATVITVTVLVSLIGYKTVMPQMGDKATPAVFWMTMFLAFGLPVIGWIFNVISMKYYDLDKERMVEVQKNIVAMKAEQEAKKEA